MAERFDRYRQHAPELAWPDVVPQTGQRMQFDRRYKRTDSRDLHMDVFVPAPLVANAYPVMLVHGGGWRSGSKAHLYPLANSLAQRGYTVFVPEYRLSVEALYPAAMVDLNDAIRWIHEHALTYDLRPDRLAVGGGSSGGHLAALLAYTQDQRLSRPSDTPSPSVSALIDMDGVLDFTSPLALRYENKRGDASAAGLWLGGAFEKIPKRWREASPVYHITASAPPTLILGSGQSRFTAGSDEVLRKLSALGIHAELIEYNKIIHTFWLFEPYLSDVVTRIDRFIQQTHAPDASVAPDVDDAPGH
ncbi:MAG: alpha/beta hydrolase fold domain-containing protein [Gammaproteobacteria bacterium]